MSIRCRPKRTASQTNNRYVHKRTNSPNSKKKCSKPLPVGSWTSERTSINGYKWLDDSKSVGSKWLIPNTNAAGVQATAIPWNKSPQEFFKKGTSIILEREYDRDVQKSRPGAVIFALWYHTFYSHHSIIIVCFARCIGPGSPHPTWDLCRRQSPMPSVPLGHWLFLAARRTDFPSFDHWTWCCWNLYPYYTTCF